MKDEEKFKHYVLDLGRLIKEYALTAVEEREKQRGQATQEFYDGYVLGFHRVISLMQQQALAFGIELDVISRICYLLALVIYAARGGVGRGKGVWPSKT